MIFDEKVSLVTDRVEGVSFRSAKRHLCENTDRSVRGFLYDESP